MVVAMGLLPLLDVWVRIGHCSSTQVFVVTQGGGVGVITHCMALVGALFDCSFGHPNLLRCVIN